MKLYILDVAMLEDPRDRIDWKEKMVDGRWERIVRYPSLEDRQTGAGAGLLLRYAFEREGIPFCGIPFMWEPTANLIIINYVLIFPIQEDM